jgi:hypothetical protein
MSSLPLVNSVLAFLATVPSVGPIVVKILDVIIAGSVLVTPLVAVWRAVVAALLAFSKVFPGLANVAAKLQTDDTAVEGFLNSYVQPIVADLSIISLPAAPSTVSARKK